MLRPLNLLNLSHRFTRICVLAVVMSMAGMAFRIDSPTLSPLLAAKMSERLGGSAEGAARQPDGRYIPLIIKLNSDDTQLPLSVVELYRRGPMVLAYVPVDVVGELASLGVVSRIEGGQVCTPVLDRALTFTSLPEITCGDDAPAYTGKGVVVGFTDTGFDPNHLAFRNDEDGWSRVALLTDYGDTPAAVTRLENREDIAAWQTDDDGQWHATHVAGIMAGGYRGNPYHGVATDAEIVATTSILTDALLLAGMEDVVGYARQQGKPAVINMSVSSSLGPHDGTSLFCQYLELLAEEAVICISAGNDGGRVGIWNGVFPADGPTAAAVIDVPSWRLFRAKGYIDVWSRDASSFDFAVLVVDNETGEVVAREAFPPVSAAGAEQRWVIGSSNEVVIAHGGDGASEMVSEAFARCFNGVATLTTEINPENGRFNGLVYVDVENLPGHDGEISERYEIALEVTGRQGQRITAYASDMLRFRDIPGNETFGYLGTDGVINDFVTGEGVIGVGAMCSRNEWPRLDGENGSGAYGVGDIAGFSSFCTGGLTGRLPDIVAPGAWLVSSVSTPYALAHPEVVDTYSHMDSSAGTDYYWASASGTSMSSPYVAGVCALWLEAKPDASPAEIKEAVVSSAVAPTVNPTNPRWGGGVLDSYAGLRKLLSSGSLGQVAVDGKVEGGLPPLPCPLTAASLADYARFNGCEVFTASGRRVAPESVSSGVYILRSGGCVVKAAL